MALDNRLRILTWSEHPLREPKGGAHMRSEVLKAKICLVGGAAVGKTSLIRRYVLDQYADAYKETLGAKITKKELLIPIKEKHVELHLDMTIWDVMGHPGFRELLRKAYFHGARGVLAVADITRRDTLEGLAEWIDTVGRAVGAVPVVIAVNKADLYGDRQYGPDEITELAGHYGAEFRMTSAKTGAGVEEAFQRLGSIIAWGQFGGALDEEG